MSAKVMDRTGSKARLEVDIEWAPAYELVMQLAATGSGDIKGTFDHVPPSFDELRTNLSPRLVAALELLGPAGGKNWGALVGLCWHLGLREPGDLIGHLSSLSAVDIRLVLLGAHLPALRAATPPRTLVAAAEGDRAAGRDLIEKVATVYPDDSDAEAFALLVGLDPEETKSAVVAGLRGWHREVFAAQEAEVARALTRDLDAKRALARTTSPEHLIEIATNGLQYTPQQWVRRVVLIPHLAMRPWNVMNAWDEATIVCYPAADHDLPADPAEPPSRLVRLHKALGDEKRLRMLRVLSSRTATLQELADATGLAKSSAHHHTVILRSAGLITVTLEDTSRYTLRREALPDVARWLDAYLETAP